MADKYVVGITPIRPGVVFVETVGCPSPFKAFNLRLDKRHFWRTIQAMEERLNAMKRTDRTMSRWDVIQYIALMSVRRELIEWKRAQSARWAEEQKAMALSAAHKAADGFKGVQIPL